MNLVSAFLIQSTSLILEYGSKLDGFGRKQALRLFLFLILSIHSPSSSHFLSELVHDFFKVVW